MTSEGYHPLAVQEHFIDSGAYPETKAPPRPRRVSRIPRRNRSFKIGMKYTSNGDVESHLAYYIPTTASVCRLHAQLSEAFYFVWNSLKPSWNTSMFDLKYLVKGSNYKKVFKVRTALNSAKDQKRNRPRLWRGCGRSQFKDWRSYRILRRPSPNQSQQLRRNKDPEEARPRNSNNCHSCAYWKPVGTVDGATRKLAFVVRSDKANREVLTGDTFYRGGWKQEARDNPGGALPSSLAKYQVQELGKRILWNSNRKKHRKGRRWSGSTIYWG